MLEDSVNEDGPSPNNHTAPRRITFMPSQDESSFMSIDLFKLAGLRFTKAFALVTDPEHRVKVPAIVLVPPHKALGQGFIGVYLRANVRRDPPLPTWRWPRGLLDPSCAFVCLAHSSPATCWLYLFPSSVSRPPVDTSIDVGLSVMLVQFIHGQLRC